MILYQNLLFDNDSFIDVERNVHFNKYNHYDNRDIKFISIITKF